MAWFATLALFGMLAGGTAASNPAKGADIYAVGGGQGDLFAPASGFPFKFSLSAHSGPNGDFGQVHFEQGDPAPLDLIADVNCVSVFGVPGMGGAWIGSIITKIDPNPFNVQEGDAILWLANDGGNPSGATPVDYFDGGFTPADCHQPPLFLAPNITEGNLVIKPG